MVRFDFVGQHTVSQIQHLALLVLGLHVIAGLGQSGLLVGCLLSTCHKGWLADAACHMKQVQAAMHSIAVQHNVRTLLHGGCAVSIPVLCQCKCVSHFPVCVTRQRCLPK